MAGAAAPHGRSAARATATFVAVAAAATGAAFGVRAINGEAFAKSAGVRPMIPGLMAAIGTGGSIRVLTVTAVGLGALAALLAAAFVTGAVRRSWSPVARC